MLVEADLPRGTMPAPIITDEAAPKPAIAPPRPQPTIFVITPRIVMITMNTIMRESSTAVVFKPMPTKKTGTNSVSPTGSI